MTSQAIAMCFFFLLLWNKQFLLEDCLRVLAEARKRVEAQRLDLVGGRGLAMLQHGMKGITTRLLIELAHTCTCRVCLQSSNGELRWPFSGPSMQGLMYPGCPTCRSLPPCSRHCS